MKSIILLISFLAIANAANILYISNVPSPSHFIWCKAILHSLHERGHNLTVLSPDVEESKPNLTFLHLDKVYSEIYNGTEEMNFLEFNKLGAIELFNVYTDVSKKSCKGSIESKGFKQFMEYPNDFKFDLVLHDITMDPCLLLIFSRIGDIPMIGLSAFNSPGVLGANLLYPAFVPAHDLVYSANMNFFQRLNSLFAHLVEYVFRDYIIDPAVDKIVHQYYPDIPNIATYKKNYKMYLINNEQITDHKQPVFPNQKNVGGLQVKKPKKLPDNLKAFADSATNGLVLFSLGTNVRSDSLGEESLLKILKALGRLNKYKFLWKFETTEKLPIDLPKNVKIQAWMPQNDVLAHKNTKLFISHCGLLSTQESLWYGVPVLGFPVFADQPQNALRLKDLKVSETLEILDFTEDGLYETIKKLLEDPKYSKNAEQISKALHDRPMSALEEATYWTEWLLRNPDIDLEGPAADMNLFQRHSLDLYTFILFIELIILYVLYKIEKFLYNLFCGKKTKVQVKSDKKRN
ncbi:unnamed protein product [Chironomus riparius]|uniref:UDP-glucuronosyltransferase n=1 Tax=Chironomus riparius TaxID=315576 RepID=A0A9N9RTI0_9DIPT|nr:unnamed protein product [Chironomus riparius]